jgi:hypothetical protein
MMNDWLNNSELTSRKYLPNAVWSEIHFVFSDMPVDIVANARIIVENLPSKGPLCVCTCVGACVGVGDISTVALEFPMKNVRADFHF